jgi:hypothetical protein
MRDDDWRGGRGLLASEEAVVSQAAAVAAAAVRAADRCGCHQCRRQTAAVMAWAVTVLDAERAAPAARHPPPWSWR